MVWIFILILAVLIIYNFYEVDNNEKHGDYYIKAPRDKNGNVIRKFDDDF